LNLKEALLETYKCSFCGECERVCPTFTITYHRDHGPRGRIFFARLILRGERGFKKSIIEPMYTCLLCNACAFECPIGVSVPEVMRVLRSVIRKGKIQNLLTQGLA